MASITEYSRFQLEASKLGRTVIFQVTVYERKERNKVRLYAETECFDAMHYMIQFIIRDADDMDGVIERFRAQLQHRGFNPVCYRVKKDNGAWDEWHAIQAA